MISTFSISLKGNGFLMFQRQKEEWGGEKMQFSCSESNVKAEFNFKVRDDILHLQLRKIIRNQ